MALEKISKMAISSEMNEMLLEYSLMLFEIKQLLRELRGFVICLSVACCDPKPATELCKLQKYILEADEPVNKKMRYINDKIRLLQRPFTDEAFHYLDFAKNLWKEIQEKVQCNNLIKDISGL